MVNNDDTLEHVGIPGMRWHHKKASGWTPSNTAAKQHITESGGKIVKKNGKVFEKPKSVSSKPVRLTDVQLRTRINRIEMEKKYATLTAPKVNPAKKMVMEVLQTAAKTTATAYVTKMMKEYAGLGDIKAAVNDATK